MKRCDITLFLRELLIRDRLNKMGSHYATEVTIDAFSKQQKRIDVLQFVPENGISISGIEKGTFTRYEIKSCREDVFSGSGLNFIGEKNYIVTTMQTWKDIQEDYRDGNLGRHIKNTNPESTTGIGIIVAIPYGIKDFTEYESPTPIDDNISWTTKVIINAHKQERKRSMVELLFSMVRSGR